MGGEAHVLFSNTDFYRSVFYESDYITFRFTIVLIIMTSDQLDFLFVLLILFSILLFLHLETLHYST